ncbi:zinc ABC transporter substrate-binding protein [Candidatus Gottesmanbacteria bacterium]|nr:zinc ABC transporter substrate-binding protein [Candidatus Gottesmanbacteria bacterium]
MKKAIFFLITALVTGFVGVWFVAQNQLTFKPESQKFQVVTSFYPLYFFAKEIGGDRVIVTNITPAGAEPHDYEPTTGDIVTMEKSDVLILMGAGFELWGGKIRNNLKDKKTMIIAAADTLATQEIEEEGRVARDPHVWLDPMLAKQIAQILTQTLETIDPVSREYYRSNMANLAKRFDALDRDFRQGFSSCQQKNFVTSHTAFGYLASRYNLTQVPITGLSPDSEPSPKELIELTKFAKNNNVTHIFFEELVSPKLAQTIASEIGAQTMVLHPIEGLTPQREKAGKDYFLLQRENLDNLKIALACQ